MNPLVSHKIPIFHPLRLHIYRIPSLFPVPYPRPLYIPPIAPGSDIISVRLNAELPAMPTQPLLSQQVLRGQIMQLQPFHLPALLGLGLRIAAQPLRPPDHQTLLIAVSPTAKHHHDERLQPGRPAGHHKASRYPHRPDQGDRRILHEELAEAEG